MDDMIREKLALKEQIDSLEQNLSKQIKENESLFKTFTVFKNESKEKENKYMENEIDLEKKIKELDNIVYKVVDVPSELPKVSLVNASLKKLKFHLTQFDFVVKKRTTPSALEEDIFNVFDKDLLNEITEVQTVFEQMEASVQQFSVDKKCLEIVFKDQFDSIKQTRVRHKEQCDSLINKLNLKSVENEDLKAQIQDKVFVITSLKNNLRKSKGKEIVENVIHIPSATTIAPGMFKLDLVPLPPRLLQNREVHINYLRNSQEQAYILREIVEQVKEKQPLDGDLDLACKYATRIQELLVYVQDTCPNAITPSTKKVESSNTSDSNTPVLSSTGVKCSTSICGSKSPGNKKNDRISQTPSRNKKNKVEAQPRKVNNMNRVVKPVCDVDVKQSLSNANSDILCATCNKSIFDGVHDKCLLDLVQNGNNHAKFAKKHKKQKWFGNLRCLPQLNVVQIILWYLDSRCSKYMTGNRSQLMNFVSKFLGTVRFGNDQIARIMGYGDYQLGNIIILRVYYLEGLGHNLFSVGQFCDADLEGKSKKTSHHLKAEDTKPTRNISFAYGLVVYVCHEACGNINWKRFSHQPSVARAPQQNSVVERRNWTLVEAARTLLIFSKALLFLWAEAINTACYTQNQFGLSFFHVFGSLCYPTNDHEDLGKFDAKADIGIFVGYTPAKKAFRIYNRRTQIITETIHVTFDELSAMASEQFSSGLGLHYMTLATSSTGLGSNPVSQQPCLPPKRDDWDQAVAPRAEVVANSPVSTSIDQDASSTSIPSSQEHEQSPIISQGFEESPKTPTFHDDPLNESPNEDLTPQGSSSNVRQIHTPFEHLGRWTKDHPIANVIGDPSRSVSTRKQLETDAMWCYFDAFLTSVEPKNLKLAMTEPSWIDAMQEEIHEFERLEVWELVSCLDNMFLIKLKWIYKVKTDESGGVIKNKASIVTQGFRQKSIGFERIFAQLLEFRPFVSS
ncbi:integrase, catalytic region, zinc finger, CCHC-type containing protein [Tanacetum coccineum]